MVYLDQVLTQWPWNPNAPMNLSDKEILTHRVSYLEPSLSWRATLLPCLPGYAYVGFRIVPGTPNVDPMDVSLHSGLAGRYVFGAVTDMQYRRGNEWTLFKFPITRRMCMLEEQLHLYVEFDRPVWGVVEFLAQRFDDLLEQDDQIVYYYWPNSNNPSESGGWIVDMAGRIQWMKTADRELDYPDVKFIYPLRGNADNNVI